MSTLILACDILEADEAHTKDNSGNGRTLRQLYNRPDVAEDTDDTPGGPIPVVEVNYTKDTEEDGGQQRLTVSINADPGNEEDTSAKLEDSLFVRIRLSSDNAFTRTDELTPQVLRDFMAEFLEKQKQSESETETSPDTFITELEAASSKGSGLSSGAKGAMFDAAALPHGPGFTISFNEERLISPEDSAEDSDYPKSLMQGQKVVEDAIAGLTPRGVR